MPPENLLCKEKSKSLRRKKLAEKSAHVTSFPLLTYRILKVGEKSKRQAAQAALNHGETEGESPGLRLLL